MTAAEADIDDSIKRKCIRVSLNNFFEIPKFVRNDSVMSNNKVILYSLCLKARFLGKTPLLSLFLQSELVVYLGNGLT